MLLSVVFLTLIVSLGALILLNANVKVQQRESTLRLTAMNLANEQFAEIESRAAKGVKPTSGNRFLGADEDLKSFSGIHESDEPVVFRVSTEVTDDGNLHTVTVTFEWDTGGKTHELISKRIIRTVSITNGKGTGQTK